MSEPTGTQYGGFWARLLAFLADSAIVFAFSSALLTGATLALGPEALTLVIFVLAVIGLLYWPVMHASGMQATPGKAMVGLRVARLDGQSISILRSVWRELSKIASAAFCMLGYLMAALMPRKQALHDLMAATYVVREGISRPIVALLVAVAGFALPVVVVPMLIDAAAMKKMGAMAESMVPAELVKQIPAPVQDGMKQALAAAQGLMKQAFDATQELIKQALAPSDPAPKAPKPSAPVAKAAAPKPNPEAVAVAPAPAPAEPAKPAAEPVKPKTEKARAEKPKPPAPKVVAKAPVPPPPPPSTSKFGSGPMYNDLMTEVMYGDLNSVNYLLRQGRWPDKPDSRGVTPLMVAAGRGDVRTAEALLKAGASPKRAVPVAQERGDGAMMALLKRYSR